MKMLDSGQNEAEKKDFAVFFWVRVLAALVVAVAVIWLTAKVVGFLGGSSTPPAEQAAVPAVTHQLTAAASSSSSAAAESGEKGQPSEDTAGSAVSVQEADRPAPVAKAAENGVAVHGSAAAVTDTTGGAPPAERKVRGVAFLDAMVSPMEYELKRRFWGWRPNDLIQFTDNVNNFQLGVLEATRRAAIRLAERISRTGTTNVLDPNLEMAMNCFMIGPESFMLPSAESKYSEGLKNLRTYKQRLISGDADFYTRADNLIPLLVAFSDLLGSCDDNLVKAKEKNGKPVSTFAADDYFYYAKGVASAILPMLEAVSEDFEETLTTRRAMDVLQQAIHSCHEASQLSPLIVLEGDMDGFLANHRANMAAYISHARFYLDVLAGTLST